MQNFANKALFICAIIILFFFFGCDDQVTDTGEENGGPNGGNEDGISFHRQAPGESARDFLTDENFSTMHIQVQYMEGYEPETGALEDRWKAFLSETLHKSGIDIEFESIPAQGQQVYTSDEVRDLEREHRTRYNEDDTLSAYFLFLDGEYENSNVLGIAYWNTSAAIFQQRVEDISGGLGEPGKEVVERIISKHEIGHLLGLVDNGTPMQTDHHDEGRGAHCDDDECLMYYAMTRDFLGDFLLGGSVPEFDELCIEDLQANGGR